MKKTYKNILIILSILLLCTGCAAKKEEASNIPQGSGSEEGKLNFTKPDLYGKVSKIIGNEVTLQLAEMPERPDRKNMTPEEREKMKQQMENMNPEQKTKRTETSLKLTGETQTIIIPVGIPITSFKQGSETQLDIGDIYIDVILQIWLNKDGTVKSVRVMQGRS